MGRKALVTGGTQRTHAAFMDKEGRYKDALLLEVDLDTGASRTLLTWRTPAELAADGLPSMIFKAGTLQGDRLYLCTLTEVLVYSWPDLKQLRHVSLPVFNDLHHVRPHGDDLHVVSTGLDALVIVGPDDQLESMRPALEEDVWDRFDRSTDYRRIHSTKPHKSHPNYTFELDGQIWLTRFEQRDAICLDDRTKRMDVGVERVHDGVPDGDVVRITSVDGHLATFDAHTLERRELLDLNPLTPTDDPLGWCRGLHVDGDEAFVGFSRIRTTRLYRNLQWIKRRTRPPQPAPTRIGVYDLASKRHVRDIPLEDAGMSAIFSILPLKG